MTYEWDRITPTSARWQQAYSFDGEQTWEKNWEMRFTRTADEPQPMPLDHLEKRTSDFDFLTGTWHVQHHRLRSRLTGCTDWDDFESTFEARTHLGGLVSVDEGALTGVDGAPYRGMTFRTYDVEAGEWRLHWFDSRYLGWDTAPVRGRFVDGVGSSWPRTCTTACRSCAGSAGPSTRPRRPAGSRRSRPTTASPGRSTGRWWRRGSPERPRHDAG